MSEQEMASALRITMSGVRREPTPTVGAAVECPQAAASGAGGAIDNIPPESSRQPRCCPVSEDTAEISLYVEWEDEAGVLDQLASMQEEARKRDENRAATTRQTKRRMLAEIYSDEFGRFEDGDMFAEDEVGAGFSVELGEVHWYAKPHGFKGKGQGGVYYPFVLSAGGCSMLFRKSSETIPNVRLIIGSVPLAQLSGLSEAWVLFQKIIGEIGGRVERQVLSRVDMYTDVTVGIDEFFWRFTADQWIGRAMKAGEYEDVDGNPAAVYRMGKRKTGWSIGSMVKLRVYDKIFEMSRGQEGQVKAQVFAERYGGELPPVLTRVEYQMRRSKTREFEICGERVDTVEEYERNKGAIWNYLTREWFRITDGAVDRKNKNQSKAKIWDVWELVGRASEMSEEDAALLKVRRVPRLGDVDLRQLVSQGMSCLVKAAIYQGFFVETREDFAGASGFLAGRYGDERFCELSHRFLVEKDLRALGG